MSEIVKTRDLSAEAKTALINFGASRQGATPPQGTPAYILGQLFGHALVSPAGNLTRIGGIVRDRVLTEALDAL